MKFKYEVSHTIIIQFVGLLFGIATSVILNRFLGPTLKGELVALLLIPQFIVTFTSLGLGMAGSYFLGKKEYLEGDILKTNFFVALILGFIGIIIGWWVFANLFPGLSLPLKLALLSTIIFGIWLCYLPDFFLGKGYILWHNWWNLGASIGKLLLIAGFFLVVTNKLNAAIVATFSVELILFFFSFFVLSKIMSLNGKINLSYLKNGLNFGYKVFLVDILLFLNYRIDILLLKILRNPTEVGYYSTATYLVESLWLIPRAVYLVFYSRFVTGRMSKDAGTQIVRMVLLAVGLAGIGSIFFIKPVIKLLYSESFLPASVPYLILLPGIIALILPKLWTSEIVGGWGRPDLLLKIMVLVVIINIGLNFVFIPRYGMNGAALASTIAYICEAICFAFLYIKKGVSLPTKISLKNILGK
ncbi:MAG: polysaccharide biosynthesis C-terminal domain-containing protein [bacterium]|nr:polysaccharide biosynthesis C-terminal domain-containing protein [bacterium]